MPICIPKREIWTRQPAYPVMPLIGKYIDIAVFSQTPHTKYGPIDLRSYYNLTPSQAGYVIDANTSGKSVDLMFDSVPTYGYLIYFNLSIAQITASTTRFAMLSQTQDIAATNGINIGASTSSFTNETICLVDSTSNRTGIDSNISIGEHVLVIQWTGDRYQFMLDGVVPTQLNTATPIGIQSTAYRHFIGRASATESRVRPYLVAISKSPAVDLRAYAPNPWKILAP